MSAFRLRRDESGIAIVLALAIMIVLAITVTSVVDYTTSDSRSGSRDSGRQSALALAEAGVNQAASILDNQNPFDGTALGSQGSPIVLSNFDGQGGSVSFYGVYNNNSANPMWTVTSTGSVRSTTTVGPITRTVTATITITPDPTQPLNVAAWNWMISTNTSDSNHCDETIDEGSAVDTPIYVFGNLCIKKGTQIVEPSSARPVSLVVGGKLAYIGDGSETVGLDAADPITEAHIGSGCTQSIGSSTHTCSPSTEKFYVRNYDTTIPSISVPAPDFASAYQYASPGPMNPCTGTGVPVFDNDGSLNFTTYPNGSAPTFELTPTASDYTCRTTDSSGNVLGELSWNHVTKVLTVKGMIYIDGSVTVSNVTTNSYTGQATLYLSGTFTMIKNAQLCANVASSGTTCDFNGWDPNSRMLMIVAHGNVSTNSVLFQQGNYFQGGIQATNQLELDKNSITEGPLIAGSIVFQKPVTAKPFPTITVVPIGASSNPNTHGSPAVPVYQNG